MPNLPRGPGENQCSLGVEVNAWVLVINNNDSITKCTRGYQIYNTSRRLIVDGGYVKGREYELSFGSTIPF